MKKLYSILLAASILPAMANAGDNEHGLTKIEGTKINLSVKDHGIAGHVNELLILGRFSHATGASTLRAFHEESLMEGKFEPKDSVLSGSIGVERAGENLLSQIQFRSFNREKHLFEFVVNQKQVNIEVKFDTFENNHYQNPTFFIKGLNQDLQFKLYGDACPNYSAHLIMMIISSWELAELLG